MYGGSQHCTGGSAQNHLQEKEMQEGRMVVWGDLTNSWEKKWKAKEKGKEYPDESREEQAEIRETS